MTEREFYTDKILDIACDGMSIAMRNGKLVPCDEDIRCRECGFFPKESGKCCVDMVHEWCESEHREEKSNEGED